MAYGGPISYVFDQAPAALAECIRVTRPGGVVLGSTMSTIGSFRRFLPGVAEEIKTFGIEAMDTLLHTGDTRPTQAGGHCCRMFRWRELAEMIAAQPCRLLAASACQAESRLWRGREQNGFGGMTAGNCPLMGAGAQRVPIGMSVLILVL